MMMTMMEDQVLYTLQYKQYCNNSDNETDDENDKGDLHNDLNADDGVEVTYIDLIARFKKNSRSKTILVAEAMMKTNIIQMTIQRWSFLFKTSTERVDTSTLFI